MPITSNMGAATPAPSGSGLSAAISTTPPTAPKSPVTGTSINGPTTNPFGPKVSPPTPGNAGPPLTGMTPPSGAGGPPTVMPPPRTIVQPPTGGVVPPPGPPGPPKTPPIGGNTLPPNPQPSGAPTPNIGAGLFSKEHLDELTKLGVAPDIIAKLQGTSIPQVSGAQAPVQPQLPPTATPQLGAQGQAALTAQTGGAPKLGTGAGAGNVPQQGTGRPDAMAAFQQRFLGGMQNRFAGPPTPIPWASQIQNPGLNRMGASTTAAPSGSTVQ
jgi:hypothetical protein